MAKPLSIYVDTHGTGQVHESAIEKAVAQCMDLTPRGIRTHLDLNKPIYERTAAYGHFGRAPEIGVPDAGGPEVQFFPWEIDDCVDDLRTALGA